MLKFDTPDPITAVLDIASGRIRLIAADRGDTTVAVGPADPGKRRDVKAADKTEVEFADGVLRIRTAAPKNQYLGPSGDLEVVVELPAGSRIEAKTAGCELSGVGRLGDVVFEGAYRRIEVEEAASLRLTAVDGDVEVGWLGGPAHISTARGAILIDEVAQGAIELSTQMGDITVGASAGASATLDADTGHGRIHNALKNTEGAAASLNIRATTGQGDITARSL
jgi:hypothetical protein